ncbi:uncharacterized protein LOC110458819 [Mizuhopecten yessoensis]|uniref:Proteoglycan 4 n=1 Tax=Mizuhopecten yessoensis TaxID=6573 RepID=A0A210Q5K2_MIZYE|nr:uncharacterized protein LOC110458819 [Mizuhopecten yessoensis]OWF44023.1 Proteoglycan 4 [Mizuhopecten yessoensis]
MADNSNDVSIMASSFTTITLPTDMNMDATGVYENNAISVQCSNDISLLMYSVTPNLGNLIKPFHVGFFRKLFFPVTPNCSNYFVLHMVANAVSEVRITFPSSQTNTLFTTYNAISYYGGDTLVLEILAYSAALVESLADLTGTSVKANVPIGMFSGCDYSSTQNGPDYRSDKVPGQIDMGLQYIVMALNEPRFSVEGYVIVSTMENTTVITYADDTCHETKLRKSGDSHVVTMSAVNEIVVSSQPIVVVHMAYNGADNHNMYYVTPVSMFRNDYKAAAFKDMAMKVKITFNNGSEDSFEVNEHSVTMDVRDRLVDDVVGVGRLGGADVFYNNTVHFIKSQDPYLFGGYMWSEDNNDRLFITSLGRNTPRQHTVCMGDEEPLHDGCVEPLNGCHGPKNESNATTIPTTGSPNILQPTNVTVPPSTNVTIPQPTNVIVPHPTNVTFPQPTNVTIPQPTNVIVPQPTNVTVPPPTNVTIPQITNVTIPPPTNVTVPQPTNVTIPQPINVTVPQPYNVTIPQPTNVTIPQPTNVTIPPPTNVTFPQPTNVTIPPPNNVTFPQPINVTVPQPYNVTIPQPTNVTVPQPTNVTIPQTTHATPQSSIMVNVSQPMSTTASSQTTNPTLPQTTKTTTTTTTTSQSTNPTTAGSKCPINAQRYNHHGQVICYWLLVATARIQNQAYDTCLQQGGQLPIIPNSEANEVVVDLISTSNANIFYLDYTVNYTSGKIMTSSGSPQDWNNGINTTQPNGPCVVTNGNGTWSSSVCDVSTYNGVICSACKGGGASCYTHSKNYCGPCSCPNYIVNQVDITEKLQRKLDDLRRATSVNKKNTSRTLRRITCASDPRPSSAAMGYLGASVLTVVFGGFILLDLPMLFLEFKTHILGLFQG